MANVALVTADTGHAAATNTKADLEANSHVVTLVADSTIGSTNFDAYDAVVAVRLSGTSTAVSPSVATALESLWDTGKPMIIGMVGAGMTVGTSRKTVTDNIGVTGGDGNGSWTIVANSAGHTEVDVVNTAHAIMSGQSLGALAIYGTANIRASLGSGRSSTGTELLEEDPNAGDLSAWLAVESGTTLLDTTSSPARLVYGDIPYGGQGSLNAAGEGLLSNAVNWVANLSTGTTLTADAGSYAITGNAATLTRSHIMVAEAGSYAVTGNAATLTAGGATFTAHGIEFDGSTFISRGADLDGAADGGDFSISFLFKTSAAAQQYIIHGYTDATHQSYVRIGSNGRITAVFYTATGGLSFGAVQNAGAFNDDAWHHCFISYDGSVGSTSRIFKVDGVDVSHNFSGGASTNFDLTHSDWYVGERIDTSEPFIGCLAEVWFALEYLSYSESDWVVGGLPTSLGVDGSLPTGTASIIYLGGDGQEAAGWETNKGSGGGFTENGALTDCATDPALSTDITLTAEAGSYALTGLAATFLRDHVLQASSASYILTGNSSTTGIGRLLSALSGSYTLTGLDVTFPRGLVIAASAGSYALTGNDATTISPTIRLTANSGEYTVTGFAATFTAPIWQNLPINPGETWADSSSGSAENWYSAAPGPGETWREEE